MNRPQTVGKERHRRGAFVLAFLPQLVLILGAATVLYVAIQNGVPENLVDIALSRVLEPVLLVIENTFGIIAPLSPILAAMIPLWIVFSDDTPATIETLTWSAAYGVGLFVLVLYAGIDIHIMALIQGSWTGAIIGGAVSLASKIGGVLIGALMMVTYWTAGILLEFTIIGLKAVTGLGKASEFGSKRARKTQHWILERIKGGTK